MATLFASDSPGRPGVALFGNESVVLTLAVRGANRVNRRQIENVKAHVANPLQALGCALKSPGHPAAIAVLLGSL